MKIAWNSRYDTGVRSIDLQHRELVEMINGLTALPDDIQDAAELKILFQRLNQYIVFHFGHEETLMHNSAVSLEHRRRHAEAHASFGRELVSRLDPVTVASGRKERDALVQYLTSWLLNHILKTDFELAVHLDAHKPLRLTRSAALPPRPGVFSLKH